MLGNGIFDDGGYVKCGSRSALDCMEILVRRFDSQRAQFDLTACHSLQKVTTVWAFHGGVDKVLILCWVRLLSLAYTLLKLKRHKLEVFPELV